MKKSLFLTGLATVFTALQMQAQVTLVKDVNTAAQVNGSNASPIINMSGTVYFSANDGSNGAEFWKTDGTPGGTVMVKDIYPGSGSGGPGAIVAIGPTMYLTAGDATNGTELWKSDGTAAGTVLVKDIKPGTGSSGISNLLVMNGNLYFQADDGVNGPELWKSDGTAAGTVMVKDIYPGATGGYPSYITVIGNTLYFEANDGTNGYELWKSDGSQIGTSMVKDINPGSAGSNPQQFVLMGSSIYFTANDGTTGRELWKTNGTSIGTSLVKDIYPGASNSMPFYGPVVYNNALYFSAYNGTNGSELWTSNGTSGGTVMVKDINVGAADGFSGTIVISNNIMFFLANNGTNGLELWISDGTSVGTGMVKDINVGAGNANIYMYGMTDINGTLYFAGDNGSTGKELWRSDGTSGGTQMILDIYPGSNQSFPQNFLAGPSCVLFMANNGTNGDELWKSDGSTGGTVLLKNIFPDVMDSYITDITAAGSNVYFSAYEPTAGTELWKSDGSTPGTMVVKDIYPGTGGSNPQYITTVQNQVYFSANDATTGNELWKSDGTTGGTTLVKDIVAGAGSGSPEYIINVSDSLYFFAYQPTIGTELWKSDGTTGGTALLKDIDPTTNYSSLWSGEMKNMNGVLYMAVQTNTLGPEPWTSHGTTANTTLLKNINAVAGSSVSDFVYAGGTVFFGADDGTNGYELWKSDGTTAGTSMVKDIKAGVNGGLWSYFNNSCVSSCQPDIAAIGNTVFFIADDGTNGGELWKSDGTSAGTVMIKDIYPGSTSSTPDKLVAVGTTLYFVANDGTNGFELWKTDGTTAGTVMVKDILTGSGSSSPDQLINFGGKLFFSAGDGVNGTELWTSQGTAATTARVSDVYPGAGSSNPGLLTVAGNTLFFTANDGVIGTELYKLGMPATLASSGIPSNVSCNGLNNGTINLNVTGGTAPYTYAWSNGATTQNLSGIPAGGYTVTVTDAWGWTSTSTFNITQPAVLAVTTNSITNVTCNGGSNGSITINVTGGTPAYMYNWSPSTPSNVTAGTYSVLVTDANGCTATYSATIAQPPALSGSAQANDALCNGASNGNATVNMTVGVSPYTYQWSASAGSQTTQTATNLAAGSYSVLVTDNTGCTTSFTVTVNQPAVLNIAASASGSPDTCGLSTGTATVVATLGGTAPYTYAWSGGGTGAVKTGLASGTHTVTVTDNHGCIASTTVSVNSVAHEPIPICMVTVDSTSTNNIIYWDKTTYVHVDSFIIYREVSTNVYMRIGSQPYSAMSQFVDTARSIGPANGNPNVGSYRYKLAFRDLCGNYSLKSPYHNTVFFLDQQNGNFQWNTYTIENQGSTPVVNFYLERDTLNNGTWAIIGTVAGTQISLTDPNYAQYQNWANWRVEASGFNCTPTMRYSNNAAQGAVVKTKSNITNNRQVGVKHYETGDVRVYPNPNNGTFTVELTSEGQTIMLYNAEGKLVMSEQMKSAVQTFSLNGIAKGVYNLIIKSDRGIVNRKLVVL